MQKRNKLLRSAGGFAVVEFVLIVVIIAAVVGMGAYVLKARNNAKSSGSNTTSSQSATTAKAGTIGSIDQLTQAESTNEMNASTGNDVAYQQAATSDNTAMSNLGGAYNDSTF